MEFRFLGPLEVVRDGRLLTINSPQQRALLHFLLINANRLMSADQIADAIWAGELPESGTKALAFHVSRLRDALAPDRHRGGTSSGLETVGAGYILRVESSAIDAARFEQLAQAGHRALADDPAAARDKLTQALALWRGEPLADVAYAEFAQPEIRRLGELRMACLEDRLEADLALGGQATVVGELEALVAANPLRERLRSLLMLALYRSGRQAEALRVAGAGRRVLSEELGIDPSPELVALEQRILHQDPGLAPPEAPNVARRRARNPYKGLRAFSEADSADFFGREALVQRLLRRLEEVARAGRLLVVVGPSGSGKSSVVRAGLIPALRRGVAADGRSWQIATVLPGAAPVDELTAALEEMPAVPGSRPLLFIDQLEEVFVRGDAATAERFVAGLQAALSAKGDLCVLATLRADFLHLPLSMTAFGELLRAGVELVTPMNAAEIERAIVRPAEAVGVVVEPALVQQIVADVERSPGALPLLQYALTQLFDAGDGQRLTRDGYAAIGGVSGALSQRANEAWLALDVDRRELMQQLFIGLVALGEDGAATTRRVPRAELESLAADAGEASALVDDLTRRGLLTLDRDAASGAATVEIAHVALIEHWSRLADWIDDLRQDLWTRRRLADAAAEWRSAERSPDFLATGAKLERFASWARTTKLRLADNERAYLTASVGEAERLQRVEAERVARERSLERRSASTRRFLVGVLVASLVLAIGLGSALFVQQGAATEQDAIARARGLALTSKANLGSNRQLSVLLALAAADTTVNRGYVTEEAYDALHWSLQEAQVPYPAGNQPFAVRQAPGGPRGVFLMTPQALMRMAAGYVHRSLTAQECREYLHEDACAATQPPGDDVSLGVRTVIGVVAPEALAVSRLDGTGVRVLSELPADISPLLSGFEKQAGITLAWDATANGDLEAQIDARDLPDVAIIARPSYLREAAGDGWLLPLDGVVNANGLASEAGDYAMELDTVNGARYGEPLFASVDDLLWYPRDAFAAAGYAPPTTSSELDALLARLRADGHTPWCFGAEAGSKSNWATSTWIEDALLDASSPAVFDAWASGKLRFASPVVAAAVHRTSEYILKPGDVFNGLAIAGGTPDRLAMLPMWLPEGPGCWLYRGSSAAVADDSSHLADRASALTFPKTSGSAQPVLGRLYSVVMLGDRPEVRRFVEQLVGQPFAQAAAARICETGLFPVREVAATETCAVAGQVSRLHAGLESDTFRTRAVDLLPERVGEAYLADLGWYLHYATAPADAGGWGADGEWDELVDSGAQ